MVAASSRTQTLFLLAPGKEGGLKECETYEYDGGSDRELSANPTTKQKGLGIMDGEAREVSLGQSQLAVGGCMEDPHQIPRKVAADPEGSSRSVGQRVRLRETQPPPPLTAGQQKEQLGSPLAPSPSSTAPRPHAPASGLQQQPMLLRSLEPLLGSYNPHLPLSSLHLLDLPV